MPPLNLPANIQLQLPVSTPQPFCESPLTSPQVMMLLAPFFRESNFVIIIQTEAKFLPELL